MPWLARALEDTLLYPQAKLNATVLAESWPCKKPESKCSTIECCSTELSFTVAALDGSCKLLVFLIVLPHNTLSLPRGACTCLRL